MKYQSDIRDGGDRRRQAEGMSECGIAVGYHRNNIHDSAIGPVQQDPTTAEGEGDAVPVVTNRAVLLAMP